MEHFFRDKEHLGMWELEHDVLFGKIPPDRYSQLIAFAWDLGRKTAHEYYENYGTRVPSQLASKLGLVLVEVQENAALPAYQVYSEYFSNQKRVVLHKDTILKAIRHLQGKGYAYCENYEQMRELFIAHEIYHHVECHVKGLTSQKQKIVTLKIGPLQITSGIRALCEIGAHGFAKTLLQLEED